MFNKRCMLDAYWRPAPDSYLARGSACSGDGGWVGCTGLVPAPGAPAGGACPAPETLDGPVGGESRCVRYKPITAPIMPRQKPAAARVNHVLGGAFLVTDAGPAAACGSWTEGRAMAGISPCPLVGPVCAPAGSGAAA